jgi:Leucine Rich repeat
MSLYRHMTVFLGLVIAVAGVGCHNDKPAKTPAAASAPKNTSTPPAGPTLPGSDQYGFKKERQGYAEKSKIPTDVLEAWDVNFFHLWTGWDAKRWRYVKDPDPATLENPIPAFSFGSIVQRRMFEKLPPIPVPFGIEGFASRANDLTFQGVEKQTNLRSLVLGSTDISDPALAEIAKVSGLERLDVSHTRITNAGLKRLAGLNKLTSLTIVEGRITDAGVKNLSPLTGLTDLDLSMLELSDRSAEVIAGFTKLVRLRFDGDGLTVAGAKALARLPELRELSIFLRADDPADAAVGELRGLKKLEWLRLNTSRMTEVGVGHLKQMTQLKYLDLAHARFDPKFNEELKTALPNCTIKFAK